MKIGFLLNPCPESEQDGPPGSESPPPAAIPHAVAPYTSVPKRTKLPKDAAIFTEGNKVVGHVNYPPYEGGEDEETAWQHRRFRAFPIGEITTRGVRHSPYNSDKKDFLNKTGRESFEMFQYVYHIPNEEKEYVVLWDYNVGLVRMTPFFKSMKYSKTIPAKALRENPGLRDISYSITGGALVCQGYWMPYEAARAIAATFCWRIRWVLTPVFGYDFPEMCLRPEDPGYGKFQIAPEIVQHCTNETNRFREEGFEYRVGGQSGLVPVDTPQLPSLNSPWEPMSHHPRKSEESGYYTGGDQNDRLTASPQVSPRGSTWISSSSWTSVNGSKSPSSSPIIHSPTFERTANELPPLRQQLRDHGIHFGTKPTSVPVGYYEVLAPTKRTYSQALEDGYQVSGGPSVPSSVASSPRSINRPGTSDSADRVRTHDELEAAELMMQLSAADQALPAPKRTRRGSQY